VLDTLVAADETKDVDEMATIEVNGIQLSVDDRGKGEAVVFVCGTGQPAEMWEMLGRPELDAAGFRTITFDNRGVQPSAVPEPPYRMRDLVDDAIGLIEHLGAGPCHLIGGSLGSNIVSLVAQQRPDLVTSAVMNVGGSNFRRGTAEKMRTAVAAYTQGGETAQQAQREDILDAMLTTENRHDPDAQEAVEAVVEMLSNTSEDWSGAIGQISANIEWAEQDHLDDAAEIHAPCLMLANELDAYFAPEDLQAAAERMTDCTFVLQTGLPHVALDPDVLAENIRRTLEFLNSQRQR
jgi:pimeloyl-ACP methyl ester carboxylesterase